MADAGYKQRVVNVWRDRVALAVDQHRGDGAVVAGEHCTNTGIDGVAQALHERVGTRQHALRRRRRNYLHRAADKTGRADGLKEQITREIVAAWFERLQRRLEGGFDFNE